jgi:hypothetical protein
VDERERQRKHRARLREEQGVDPPVSRAGLVAEVRAAVEEMLEKLGQAQRLSLAGLRRQVRRDALKILAEFLPQGAESGTRSAEVTDRPRLVNC